MTYEEILSLPKGTIVWDRDFGAVVIISCEDGQSLVEVIKYGQQEVLFTWIEDLSPITSLLRELA